MEKLSKKEMLLVGLMLFSMFFGAGNLIFPPFLGQAAGEKLWVSLGAFFITAVGFPILGVVAVARSGGLYPLAKRVHPVFAGIFTVLIYLSIGPFLGIPRAGSLPFEMVVAPYLPDSVPVAGALFGYTLVFFAVAYWLSLSPGKLVNRMGKVLTPTLLTMILVMFAGSFVKPLGAYGNATGTYATQSFVQGFLDGYLTMDTIAALNFGIVIALAIRSRGIKEEKAMIKTSIKAGLIAGTLLITIYSMLGHLGAMSGAQFGTTENGAQTLTNIVTYMYGMPGAVLLAAIFTLACLSTSVGLITSCSQYFSEASSKISYKGWVRLITGLSMTLANMGLTKILAVSVPVLVAIYPVAIMLIVLAMMDSLFKGHRAVYASTVAVTALVSSIDALEQSGIVLGWATNLCQQLPLYAEGLGWLLPAAIGMGFGSMLLLFGGKSGTNQEMKPVWSSQK